MVSFSRFFCSASYAFCWRSNSALPSPSRRCTSASFSLHRSLGVLYQLPFHGFGIGEFPNVARQGELLGKRFAQNKGFELVIGERRLVAAQPCWHRSISPFDDSSLSALMPFFRFATTHQRGDTRNLFFCVITCSISCRDLVRYRRFQ
jgi:hypothetical protein